ncbi:MAG: phosphatase PAP2 family protein [Paracoccus hibiscisoli]|uniref:phosphatase PAP2 family protein n=1 Tax=Paracoccus hibiscisoli TaxID=2023261 RepID=UPI00391A332F
MSLSNAHNMHNMHNMHAASAAAGDATLAQALLLARDAVAPMAEVEVGRPSAPMLDPARRLSRIEPQFAAAALLSELVEGIAVSAEADAFKIDLSGGTLLTITPPTLDHLIAETQLVASYAELRLDRLPEIMAQTGHLLPFFTAILPLSTGWTPAVMLLASVTQDLATAMVQRAKLGFGLPRPHVLSPDIQPVIDCPHHTAFPSGHATQAFALARVLAALSGRASADVASPLDRMAARVATNRTVAGLHYPSDSAAGAVLGLTLGGLLVARATGGDAGVVHFDAQEWGTDAPGGTRDFHLPALCRAWQGGTCLTRAGMLPVRRATLLGALWDAAEREWQERWG